MSTLRSIIREFIIEQMMSEAVIKRDDAGQLVIRKVINYHKPTTRFHAKDVVDAEVQPSGDVTVNDVETWKPDLDTPAQKVYRRKRRHLQVRKVGMKKAKVTDL